MAVDLSVYVKPAKGQKGEKGSDRSDSAYTQLNVKGIPVRDFLGAPSSEYHTLKYVRQVGVHFLLSNNEGLKYAPQEVIEVMAFGEDLPEGVFIFMSAQVAALFFGEDAPRTKCHDYWFALYGSEPVFLALQGNSIKVVRSTL